MEPGSVLQAMKSTSAFGTITMPQQISCVCINSGKHCESTKSLSVDNLQAVHHVDTTDYCTDAVAAGFH